MISTNILLGAIAGVTIFLGLPVARWHGQSQQPSQGVVVDKMVATVNGELVTYSDVLFMICTFGP